MRDLFISFHGISVIPPPIVCQRHAMDSHILLLFSYKPIISITDRKIATCISQLSWHAQNSVAITLATFSLAYLRYPVIWGGGGGVVGAILICLPILTIPALFYMSFICDGQYQLGYCSRQMMAMVLTCRYRRLTHPSFSPYPMPSFIININLLDPEILSEILDK